MSEPYIDGSTLDECREALRQGRKLEDLAGVLKCTPEHLRRLLGEPVWKQILHDNSGTDFDLFAADRLDGVL